MLFSIIIPVYNDERFIAEALASVQSQTFPDYEVVLVDDGSTDNTPTIIDSFAGRRENVLVYHGENEGLLLARRRGLKLASGDYIVFLDADDCIKRDALELLAAAIEVTRADIVSFRVSRNSDYSPSARSAALLKAGLYEGAHYQRVLEHACKGRFSSLCSKAIRSRCFDVETDYSKYAGLMHTEDLLQLLPVLDNATSLVQLNDILYFYRPNDTMSTARYKSSQLSDTARVCHELLRYAYQWGNVCVEHAILGELNQYLYLFKISEMSGGSRRVKREVFFEIRSKMEADGAMRRASTIRLGTGEYLLYDVLKKGDFPKFKALIRIAVIVSEAKLPYSILARLRRE